MRPADVTTLTARRPVRSDKIKYFELSQDTGICAAAWFAGEYFPMYYKLFHTQKKLLLS